MEMNNFLIESTSLFQLSCCFVILSSLCHTSALINEQGTKSIVLPAYFYVAKKGKQAEKCAIFVGVSMLIDFIRRQV